MRARFAIPGMVVAGIVMLVLSCGDGAVEPSPPAPEPSRAQWTLSGTVSHGWADPESGPSVANPGGRVVGAVVEVVDGPDAGRQVTTDDLGQYLLESWKRRSSPFAQQRRGSRRPTELWS